MKIENLKRIGEITRTIHQAVFQLELLPEIVNIGFSKEPNYALGTMALMPQFEATLAESPAAQAFVEAYKAELEAEIDRLKTELETL